MKGGDEETLTHEEADRILAWYQDNRGNCSLERGCDVRHAPAALRHLATLPREMV